MSNNLPVFEQMFNPDYVPSHAGTVLNEMYHADGKPNGNAQVQPLLSPRIAEECAFFQANQMLRECNAEDFEAAAKVYERFYDTISRAWNPDVSLARVIGRLGRERARQIGLERHVIEAAIRNKHRLAV